jgi:putative hydrolase of the HAD superfamily
LRPPADVRGVIFDGDDTLWLTEHLYDEARQRARGIIEKAGLDGDAWEAAQRSLDLANVSTLGHTIDRFPTSSVQALWRVSSEELVDANVRQDVWDAAASVFDSPAPLRDGALETLTALANRGSRLGLLTKGDAVVQRRRIEQSGLERFFDVVEIVDRKDAGAFDSVARQLGVRPAHLISVGNSIESDVLPSVAAGIFGVWLPAYVWAYEHHHPAAERDVARVDGLREVLSFVD